MFGVSEEIVLETPSVGLLGNLALPPYVGHGA